MMLTYEQFAIIVGHIKEQIEKEQQLSKSLQETLVDGYIVCKISFTLIEDIISLVEFNFMDKYRTLDWWIWECDFGTKHAVIYDGNEHEQHNLSSVENLYNYLKENYKTNMIEQLKSYVDEHDNDEPLSDPSILFQKVNNLL
jgi:hypothetical protein